MQPSVTIIIPVYNERKLIKKLLNQVLDSDTSPFSKEVIVVDDGSTDGTSDILKGFNGITIVTHPNNLGKASAIKSALSIASGDVILIQDADLEYSPEDYKRLLLPFIEKNADIVYGSRFLLKSWPKDMRLPNWIANKLFTFLVNILYKTHITDEGTGYKLFKRDVIKSIDIECSGFSFCPEATSKLLKKGLTITEVPVSYTARNKKEGKKPNFKDGLKVLWTIIKYRFKD